MLQDKESTAQEVVIVPTYQSINICFRTMRGPPKVIYLVTVEALEAYLSGNCQPTAQAKPDKVWKIK